MLGPRLTLGPTLLGVLFNMILYGVLLVQMHSYHQTYRNDKPWIKYLVLYLFIVETINSALDIHIVYEPLILQFGTPAAITYFPTMLPSKSIVLVSVSTPIQIFFAWRIRLLTKRNWVPAIIVLFAVLSLAGGIWSTVMLARIRLIIRKPELHPSGLLLYLSSCITDIIITTALVMSLSKRRTGCATDDAISKIIRMTVQTGMLTAFFALGDVIFFMTLGHTTLNFMWDLALAKLYSNCLLSTLNARAGLKDLANTFHTSPGQGGPYADGIPGWNRPYELDDTIKSCHESSPPPHMYGPGITVTKVVERQEDPSTRPSMGETT